MKHTEEWKRGDTAQRRWGQLLAGGRNGRCVLPAYAFEDVLGSGQTKAPVMLAPEGILITPDCLSMSRIGSPTSALPARDNYRGKYDARRRVLLGLPILILTAFLLCR